MSRMVVIGLCVGVLGGLLAAYLWRLPNDIRHYTEAELLGSTCAELSEKHEEVIFAYHDASLARKRKTGSFDDPGLPAEDMLPLLIVMKKVIRDNEIAGLDLTQPFFHSPSAAPPRLHSDFYAEISAICATNPAMDAGAAMLQAARNLGLTHRPVTR
ncbi:hypothetical protein K3X41_09615 [Aliiroseovarius crassostreae]|uniref:hypothetical protein n=1 Tax=Aliiroseovarius crassostreae TaxID=154981 RepID=UPI00220825D5|nr:hypothetical protein [Aliiroseovarius crassostreae]UWQ10186.1 hypothetical protein K3X41_09615 [Aliiroseovarius crassostreae]